MEGAVLALSIIALILAGAALRHAYQERVRRARKEREARRAKKRRNRRLF
jgi:hypothetical protein